MFALRQAYHLDENLESLVFPFLLKEYLEDVPHENRPKVSDLFCGISAEMDFENSDLEIPDLWMRKISKSLDIDLIRSQCTFKDFAENLLDFNLR